jgi:hypothetical protein
VGSREKRRRPRKALASILFVGSMVCVMLCMIMRRVQDDGARIADAQNVKQTG